jgi:hypothetical protein
MAKRGDKQSNLTRQIERKPASPVIPLGVNHATRREIIPPKLN